MRNSGRRNSDRMSDSTIDNFPTDELNSLASDGEQKRGKNMEDVKRRRGQDNEGKARKKKIKGKKSRKKKIVLALLSLVLLGLLFFLYQQVLVPEFKASKPISVLLAGSDTNSYRDERYGGTKAEKTDSLMVLTYNPSIDRIVMTSIPRDTAVDYACGEIRGKINEIYAASDKKISCLEQSVEDYLNIPINNYVKVNMDQIEEMLEEVGPIKIKVHAQDGYLSQKNVDNTKEYSWTNGETVEMDADEALTYARVRKDSEKDYGRGIRQQQVIMAMVRKINEKKFDIGVITKLFEMVDTDMQLLLAKKYLDVVQETMAVTQKIDKGEEIPFSELGENVWKNMYETFEFGKSDVNRETVKEFNTYLKNNKSEDDIKKYFLEQHQIYNSSYSGYYVTPKDQLFKVSNALRKNLGLGEETPKEPSKPFGTVDFGKEIVVTKDENVSPEYSDEDLEPADQSTGQGSFLLPDPDEDAVDTGNSGTSDNSGGNPVESENPGNSGGNGSTGEDVDTGENETTGEDENSSEDENTGDGSETENNGNQQINEGQN